MAVQHSLNRVWDTGTLRWVVMTQPTAGSSDATAANQATEIAKLTSIDGKLPALVSSRVPVDGSGVTQPVSGTFFQATQPVSVASLPLPSSASTEATLALIKAKTDNLDVALSTRTKPADTQAVSVASLPLPTGAATETTLGTRLSESDFDTKTGSLTESAPASDTASSGLNGRLQRIAQRLTSLIALLPAALTGSGNLKVALVESTASQAVTGTFFQATQPISGTVTDGGAGKTLKTVAFSLSATGTVVAAVASKRLKVYAVKLVVSAALSVNFRDGGSTNLEGAQSLALNGGFVESVNPPAFLFATTAGNSLDLVISGVGTAAGRVSYWDDDAT